MAQQQMEVSTDVGYHGARLVWVLNRDAKPYVGTFGGKKISIPASSEKIPKHALEGGNLMRYLEARQFITDFKEPQGFTTDNAGKMHPIFGPKALYDHELTEDEFNKYVGKSKDQVKKEKASDERKARKQLNAELNKVSNKIALGDDDE